MAQQVAEIKLVLVGDGGVGLQVLFAKNFLFNFCIIGRENNICKTTFDR